VAKGARFGARFGAHFNQIITFPAKGPSTFETAGILKMKRDLASSSERALLTKDFKELSRDRELRVNTDGHAYCGLVTIPQPSN
jgi:hypothetical protein